MTITLSALQKQRRDTAANWTAENPTLLAGEIGIEADTGKIKIGNGSSAWASLGYQGIIPASGTYPLNQLIMPLGTAGAPPLTFTGDVNTGIYSPGTDQLALATGGTGRIFVNAAGNTGIGTATTNVPLTIQADSGQASIRIAGRSADGLSYAEFTNNAQTLTYGYFSSGPTYLAAGAGTTEAIRISSTGQLQCGTLGTAAAPVISFSADTNTGIYSPGADQVAISTNSVGRLFVDASGRVGIGTTSPSQILTANGAIQATSNSSNFDQQGIQVDYFDGGSIGRFAAYKSTGSNIGFFTNSSGGNTTERARIDSSGRLGVGTSSPGARVHSDWNSGSQFRASNGSATFDILNDSTNSLLISSGPMFYRTGTSGPHIFQYNNGSNEALRIDSSGRLLVGTSSVLDASYSVSGGPLQISGAENPVVIGAYINNSFGSRLDFVKSRSNTANGKTVVINGDQLGSLIWGGTDGTSVIPAARITAEVDGTPGTNDMPGRLVFSTTPDSGSSPVERMRITQNGFTKHSNTGAYLSVTAAYHEFRSDAGSGAVTLNVSNSNATGNGLQSGLNSDGTAYAHFIGYSTSAAANRIIIWSNGNVVNTNNSYGAISDIKLKENIVDAGSQWSDIKALQVRKYNFKEGQTHTQIGLVAQEVERVSPGLVTESPDRDAEGNDLGTVTKSVNYSVLYMKAVKALQEAMERIETLEAKVAVLEAKP